MKQLPKAWMGVFLVVGAAGAQSGDGQEGFEWGSMRVRPEARAEASYSDRVILLPNDEADGDSYADLSAGVRLNNLPARYDLSAKALYGQRFYTEFTDLDDDFYSAGAAIDSSQDPFKWGLSTDYTKTLDYNTAYDPSTGQDLDSILVDGENRRSITQGNIAYDRLLTDKLSIMPGYALTHYYQDFTDTEAEWQIHEASFDFRLRQSEQTLFTLGGSYSLQVNDDDDGKIAEITVGAEGRVTEKTTWSAEIGYAVADYEESGTDQGMVNAIRATWAATDKVSAYVFGGNDFQPGYNGGAARRVYRLGYGVEWRMLERLVIGGSVLHDYQEDVGGKGGGANAVTDEVRHFLAAQAAYALTDHFSLTLGGRHDRDEFDPPESIATVGIEYR